MDGDDVELLDPHHRREHGRMILRAIDKGWIGNGRWPNGLTEKQINDAIRERGGEPTLKEKAVLATFQLLDGDNRAKGIGARIATTMERQNQIDDQHDIETPPDSTATTATQIGVQINMQINDDQTAERQRTELLGIIAALRERRGTDSDQGTAGGPGIPAGSNGHSKAGKP